MINEDILKDAHIKKPEKDLNWEDFENLAEKVDHYIVQNDSKEDLYAISLGPGGKEGLFMDAELLTLAKERPFVESGEVFSDKELLNSWTFFIEMYKKYGIKEEESLEYEAFYQGKIPLRISQGHELDFIYNKKGGEEILGTKIKDFDFSISPIPVFSENDELANIDVNMSNIAISTSSRKKDTALKVIEYAMSKSYAEHMIKTDRKSFEGNFVTYYDKDTLNSYEHKYPGIDIEKVFYFGSTGPYNGYAFQKESDYALFHELCRKYFPLILDGDLSVEEGLRKIKHDHIKGSKGD
ncbi:hypothetical protein [Mechercharimyces sp. CAU 1602]|uniref:hypothetical protein n=1 Tax=Mechercharimyces sp. CAU 1602 TaxID=2973933 RepID=UPI0037C5CF6C